MQLRFWKRIGIKLIGVIYQKILLFFTLDYKVMKHSKVFKNPNYDYLEIKNNLFLLIFKFIKTNEFE